MSTTQLTPAQNLVSFFGETAMNGCTGAFSAWALTTINPIAGAVFGITSTWGSRIVSAVCETVKCTADSIPGKITRFAIEFLGGIGLGILATSLMGYPLTFTAGLILTAAWFVTGIAFTLIAGACVSSSAIPVAAASRR